MLTIGQLEAHAGVTVRAVRHHQRGLLAEPERDASGYRRYDAQAVVELIRIKTLGDAGVLWPASTNSSPSSPRNSLRPSPTSTWLLLGRSANSPAMATSSRNWLRATASSCPPRSSKSSTGLGSQGRQIPLELFPRQLGGGDSMWTGR
ncbi:MULTISPECIES: MerR family transcriptional regulator [Streptomyces]|uniref:MerR family transcriptional regulator n=1 Tax=Streptomyces TaxID=1883 RepID=UPI0035A935F4